jgi:glucose 1-dehydrogenase
MLEALRRTAPTGTACLIGIPAAGSKTETDLGDLYRQLVLTNQIVVATITANRRHFEEAIELLAQADHDWLSAMTTLVSDLADWQEAFQSPQEHVKTVIQIQD